MRWFYELLSLSLSVTPIIILLLWLNPIIKKRYSARWRYILWIAISIRLLLPFSFANQLLVLFKAPEILTEGILPSVSIDGQLTKLGTLPESSVGFDEVLFVVYCIVAILYLVREIFSYIGFRRDILRWSRKPSDCEIQTILIDEKKRLNIKRNVPVLINKKVPSPMLVGLIRPTLVLHSDAYTPDELRMILIHELVHLKRNDILLKTIIMVTSAVHWFNPAVHFMAKQANKDMEQSCDDYVLNGSDIVAKKFYCNIILKMAALNNNTVGSAFSTNIVSSRKNLESRIKDIFDNTKKKRGVAVLITVMLLVTLSSTIFNVIDAEQLENLSIQNEFLDEHIKANNENINENKVKNEFENSEYENKVMTEDNNQPQNVIDTSDSKKLPAMNYNDSSREENSQDNSMEKQEEIIIEDGGTEIVIVDLTQLENQFHESTTVDKPE